VRAHTCVHTCRDEYSVHSLPHCSPSLSEPQPTVLTSVGGRMLLAIHLPPPYHVADMISHAWSFTKVQREFELFGLADQSLLPTELSSQSPSGYGLSHPSCPALCCVCVSVSKGIFSHRNGSIPTCLCAYTQNRVSLLSAELIQRWTCSDCSP